MADHTNVKQVFYSVTAQELCESRDGRPGPPILISLRFCGRKAKPNNNNKLGCQRREGKMIGKSYAVYANICTSKLFRGMTLNKKSN